MAWQEHAQYIYIYIYIHHWLFTKFASLATQYGFWLVQKTDFSLEFDTACDRDSLLQWRIHFLSMLAASYRADSEQYSPQAITWLQLASTSTPKQEPQHVSYQLVMSTYMILKVYKRDSLDFSGDIKRMF